MIKWLHVERLYQGWKFEDGHSTIPSRYGWFNGSSLQLPLYNSSKIMEDDENLFICVELGKVTRFGRTTRPWRSK
jgi:hypothetical protein